MMPAIGGGLCQLSNALYDVALRAGCEIVERHAHSHPRAGIGRWPSGRDATVRLELTSICAFHAAVELMLQCASWSRRDLIVSLLTKTARTPARQLAWRRGQPDLAFAPDRLRRRAAAPATRPTAHFTSTAGAARWTSIAGRAAFVVDEYWPEFAAYVAATRQAQLDLLCAPNLRRWSRDGCRRSVSLKAARWQGGDALAGLAV